MLSSGKVVKVLSTGGWGGVPHRVPGTHEGKAGFDAQDYYTHTMEEVVGRVNETRASLPRPTEPVTFTPPPVPSNQTAPKPNKRIHTQPMKDRYGYYTFDEYYAVPPSMREASPDAKWYDPDRDALYYDWNRYPGMTPFYGWGA